MTDTAWNTDSLLFIPQVQAAIARPRSTRIKNAGQQPSNAIKLIQAGDISWTGTFPMQVAEIYASIIGRKLDSDAWTGLRFDNSVIIFRNEKALTKEELLYALDTLFEWRNFKLVVMGEDGIKPVALSSP